MHVSLPLTIGFLSRSQQQLFAELVPTIVDAVHPEKIICFGIRSIHYQDWGCFMNEAYIKERSRLSLDLLVISSAAKGQTEQDMSQSVEEHCKTLANVHCVVHKINTVNGSLSEGKPFYSALYHHGIILYDSGQTALLNPGPMERSVPERAVLEGIWSRWHGLAAHFFRGAVDSLSYNRPDLTTFLLHQAVEHTCGALIRVFTGYRPNTHSLTRLFMMAENFSNQFTQVFPRVTKEEEEIYGVLQRGYLDTRYKEDYVVSPVILQVLIERVGRIQSIAETLYKEKLASYSQTEAITKELTISNISVLP
jgi:HEPN domain-containing protein